MVIIRETTYVNIFEHNHLDFFVNDSKVGCSMVETFGDGVVGIWGVKIYEDFRGKGYAKTLMSDTIEFIRNFHLGTTKIFLLVYLQNRIARNLYRKLGFNVVRVFRDEEEKIILRMEKAI